MINFGWATFDTNTGQIQLEFTLELSKKEIERRRKQRQRDLKDAIVNGILRHLWV